MEESEKTLRAEQKFSELIILYQLKGHHKEALQLLQSQADVANSCLSGHEPSIRYLQHLGTDHKAIIFEFANWVLDNHPEDGLKIFTEDIRTVKNLPRAEVVNYLLENHKALAIPYLLHVIYVWHDPNLMFRDTLIQLYRSDAIRRSLEGQPNDDSSAAGKLF